MAINTFRERRCIRVNSELAEHVYPERGVLADHGFAMSPMHVYYMPSLDNFVVAMANVALADWTH